MMAKEELATETAEITEDGNIDKIRDILFGVQVRDFEKRFAQLEESFTKQIQGLKSEVQSKLDKLEHELTKEHKTLKGRVDDEPFLRDDAIQNATKTIIKTTDEINSRISELSTKATEGENELRAQILQQSIMLMDALRKTEGEIVSMLEQQAKGLREEKADRAGLAELFTDLAGRLTGDQKSEQE